MCLCCIFLSLFWLSLCTIFFIYFLSCPIVIYYIVGKKNNNKNKNCIIQKDLIKKFLDKKTLFRRFYLKAYDCLLYESQNFMFGIGTFTRCKSYYMFPFEELLRTFYVTLPYFCKYDTRVEFCLYFSYFTGSLDDGSMLICFCILKIKKTCFICKIYFWFYGRIILSIQIVMCPKSV